jgi:hypothetical protein
MPGRRDSSEITAADDGLAIAHVPGHDLPVDVLPENVALAVAIEIVETCQRVPGIGDADSSSQCIIE